MSRVVSFLLLALVAWPAKLLAQERYLTSYAGFGGFQAPAWAAKDSLLSRKESRHRKALPASLCGNHLLVHDKQTQRGGALQSLAQAERYRRRRRDLQIFASTFSFPPRVSHEGMRIAIDMLAQRDPAATLDPNVNKYVDERLLDELERQGLFKRLSEKS